MNKSILAALSLAIAFSPPEVVAQTRLSPAAAMEDLVSIDARTWVWNSYDRGSMRNVGVAETSADGRVVVFSGQYTFNGGQSGWARARYIDGQFSCVEFWDYSGSCRPLSQSPSRDVALGLFAIAVVGVAGAAVAGAGSSGGLSSSSSRQARREDPRDYGRSASPPPSPPAAPQTPIGGEGGLYGCASPPCW